MLLNLTDLSNEPLQSQIYGQLRAKILSGELEAGFMLPSIRALAREQKVSVITVQRGYEMLEREDLIISRRGKGYFVVEIGEQKKTNIALEKFIENISPIIKTARDEGLSKEEIRNSLNRIINNQSFER